MKSRKVLILIIIFIFLIVSFHFLNEFRTKKYLENVKIKVTKVEEGTSLEFELSVDPPPPFLTNITMTILSKNNKIKIYSLSNNLSFVKKNGDEFFFDLHRSNKKYRITFKSTVNQNLKDNQMYAYLINGKYSVFPSKSFHSKVFVLIN